MVVLVRMVLLVLLEIVLVRMLDKACYQSQSNCPNFAPNLFNSINLKNKKKRERDALRCYKIGAHHLIVFMVDDMAMPDISRANGWVERVTIHSWMSRARTRDRCILRGETDSERGYFAGVNLVGVFPTAFVWPRACGASYEVRCY
jgi:hypothetical protein